MLKIFRNCLIAEVSEQLLLTQAIYSIYKNLLVFIIRFTMDLKYEFSVSL